MKFILKGNDIAVPQVCWQVDVAQAGRRCDSGSRPESWELRNDDDAIVLLVIHKPMDTSFLPHT